jgi:hypothetical protein
MVLGLCVYNATNWPAHIIQTNGYYSVPSASQTLDISESGIHANHNFGLLFLFYKERQSWCSFMAVSPSICLSVFVLFNIVCSLIPAWRMGEILR